MKKLKRYSISVSQRGELIKYVEVEGLFKALEKMLNEIHDYIGSGNECTAADMRYKYMISNILEKFPPL